MFTFVPRRGLVGLMRTASCMPGRSSREPQKGQDRLRVATPRALGVEGGDPPPRDSSEVGLCPHKSKSCRSTLEEGPLSQMGKGKKLLEDRQRIRKQMGSLKSLTLQPRTRARYDKAKQKFYTFLADNNVDLPHQRSAMDALLCHYLEHRWSCFRYSCCTPRYQP